MHFRLRPFDGMGTTALHVLKARLANAIPGDSVGLADVTLPRCRFAPSFLYMRCVDTTTYAGRVYPVVLVGNLGQDANAAKDVHLKEASCDYRASGLAALLTPQESIAWRCSLGCQYTPAPRHPLLQGLLNKDRSQLQWDSRSGFGRYECSAWGVDHGY
jgi:hypothetical protein